MGADKVVFEQGVYLDNYGADWQMEEAAKACDGADAAVVFLGLSSIKDHRIPTSDFLEVKENWVRASPFLGLSSRLGARDRGRPSGYASWRQMLS